MTTKPARKAKHVPKRTCIGCREVLSKRSLIRIVRTPEGVRVDPSGKANGRGAYLHERRSCWQQALKGALAHALKVELANADRLYLAAYIENLPEESSTDSSQSSD